MGEEGKKSEPPTNMVREETEETQTKLAYRAPRTQQWGYLFCHHAKCGKLVLTNSRGRNQVLRKDMGATKTSSSTHCLYSKSKSPLERETQ